MRSHQRCSRRWIGAAIASIALAGSAACSSADGKTADKTTPPAGGGTSATSSSVPAPEPNTVNVAALDSASAMKYQISGSPRPGLVTISFDNKGRYAHEMALVQLKPGATIAKLAAALKGPDAEKAANALFVNPDAEITAPSIIGPGMSETATVKLDAGHYAVICFLPGPDGMPHAMMGMIGEMSVAGAPSTAEPPQIDGTVALTDKSITLPPTFAQGGTFAVTNSGTKPHDFSLANLKHQSLSAFFQCVLGSFGKGTPIDKCSGVVAGGLTTLQPGETAYLKVPAFGAGTWGYVSSGGDGADYQAGMNGTFDVK